MSEIGITGNMKLNEYEMTIASNLVDGRSIPTQWKDIAGLEEVVQELVETVILPIQKRDLFSASQLTQAPKGVLLHGPPGIHLFDLCDDESTYRLTKQVVALGLVYQDLGSFLILLGH